MIIKQRGSLLALGTVLVLTLLFRYHLANLQKHQAVDVAIERLPLKLGHWTGVDTAGLDTRSKGILKLTRYVRRQYTDPAGHAIFVYLGYWKEQTGDYQAAKHSPALCLPSNGWQTKSLPSRTITLGVAPNSSLLRTNRMLGSIKNEKHLFYYWFFAGTKDYAEDWYALLTISLQKIFYGRTDGGIVEVSATLAPEKNEENAAYEQGALIEDFLSALYPELRKLILESNQVADSASQE
jgi:EpsI family protein